MSAIVAIDTETTGLSLDDDIWEFGAIRREEDGTETTTHLFLQHSTAKCQQLPESFRLDHERRFPASHTEDWHLDVLDQKSAAHAIANLLNDKPHVIGAMPNFDTERIALLLRRHGREPRHHYHLIDVENLAVGWIYGRYGTKDEAEARAVSLPWDSDELSRAVGVEPPGEGERHTAMGDARWCLRLWDAVTGGGG